MNYILHLPPSVVVIFLYAPPPPPTIQAIIAQSPIANLKHQYRTQLYLINLILIQPKIATTLNDRLKLQPKPS